MNEKSSYIRKSKASPVTINYTRVIRKTLPVFEHVFQLPCFNLNTASRLKHFLRLLEFARHEWWPQKQSVNFVA